MKKSELLELLKDIADDGDVLTTLKGIEGIKNNYTLEEFKEQLKTNAELKGYYQSQIDSGIGKGVASFKEKTLPSIIAEEVKKANLLCEVVKAIPLSLSDNAIFAIFFVMTFLLNRYRSKLIASQPRISCVTSDTSI